MTDAAGNDVLVGPPRGIILNFIICGNEVLTLNAAGSAYLELVVISSGPGTTTFAEPYTTWFDLTVGPLSHSSCGIEKYYLGGCYTPGYEGVKYLV